MVTAAHPPTPDIGHNRPPFDLTVVLDPEEMRGELEREFQHKIARRDELLAGVARFNEATSAGIVDAETQARAADFVRQIKQEARAIDQLRTAAKEPVLHAGRVIDGFFRPLADPLMDAARGIEAKMTAFARAEADRKRRAALEAARAQAAAAAKAAEEAARRADADALAAAVDREQQAIEAEDAAVAGKPADLSRTHGDLGSVASLHERWAFDVTDPGAVPRQYMRVDEVAVRVAIRAGVRAIDGIRIYRDSRVVVR